MEGILTGPAWVKCTSWYRQTPGAESRKRCLGPSALHAVREPGREGGDQPAGILWAPQHLSHTALLLHTYTEVDSS